MTNRKLNRRQWVWLTFISVFCLTMVIVTASRLNGSADAAARQSPPGQEGTYAGSGACANCHKEIHAEWVDTRHAHAFSSPIFQRDWSELHQDTTCLECHTAGYNSADGTYAEEGVTCESCHGPFNPNHPAEDMTVTPNAELCSNCHKSTTDEWHASPHSQADIQCEACHNPHSQTPMAATVSELCTNCHKERGDSFTHGTHANAGLECSNCHMYTAPRTEDAIMGLVPTGHTFSVGSDACIGCHQDTVHTRDELIKLSGQVETAETVDIEDLQQTIHAQEQAISDLEASSNVRLYTGLIQGAIVGLVTGGVAAWVVSRRIKLVEVEE